MTQRLVMTNGSASVFVLLTAAAALAATAHGAVRQAGAPRVAPHIVQTGKPPLNWTQVPLLLPKNTKLVGIAPGANGSSMWLTDAGNNRLIGLRLAGGLVSYPLKPVVNGSPRVFQPAYLTAAADTRLYIGGCVYFGRTCQSGYIVAASGVGALTAYPTGGGPGPYGHLVLGPDGDVWFPAGPNVAKISPQGVVTSYAIPGSNSGASSDIAVGADGNVWFTFATFSSTGVGYVVPQTGKVSTFPLTCQGSFGPAPLSGLAPGNDGLMYAVCVGPWLPNDFLYQLTGTATDGSQTTVALVPGMGPIIAGPDRAIWFVSQSLLAFSAPPEFPLLGRFDSLLGIVTTYQAPFVLPNGGNLAAGPDGNIWIVDPSKSPAVDVFIRNELSVAPSSLNLKAGHTATLYANYTGFAPLSTTSSNTSVATVARGPKPRTFVVTAVGAGAASIVVADTVHNSFNVPVTVAAGVREPRRRDAVRAATKWTRFSANVPHPKSLVDIVTGPDGALWYTESTDNLLVRMTTTGATTSYPLSVVIAGHTYSYSPAFLTVGADQRFYLGGCLRTAGGCKSGWIAVTNPGGTLSVYKTPSGDGPGLTNRPGPAPDGNVWFNESAHIAKITPSGTITEYPYPQGVKGVAGAGVAAGADGNVWFTFAPSEVAKIIPSSGAISTYPITSGSPSGSQGCADVLTDIAAAADGNLYVGCGGQFSLVIFYGIYQVTTAGNSTYFTGGWGVPTGAITGPDGHAWFLAKSLYGNDVVQEFSPGANSTTTYISPVITASLKAIATGPDRNIWALDDGGFVDVLALD